MKYLMIVVAVAELTLTEYPKQPAPACVGAQCEQGE